MSSNKGAKRTLIMKYGKKCFIEELGLRTKKEIDQDRKRYKGKKQRRLMDELTYHHILEKCKGRSSNRRKRSNFKTYKSYLV